MNRIALVEDEDLIRNMIRIGLKKENFDVSVFADAELFLSSGSKKNYDVIILDIMLPGISGTETLKKIRKSGNNTPVLMVTAKGSIDYKTDAFLKGADDYLVKPFNMDELILRLNALIKRSQGKRVIPSSKKYNLNGFIIDLESGECESNYGEERLSEKELKLISFFIANQGKILNRADILEEVWGMDVFPTPRTIDNFILKFRKMFETDRKDPKIFISIRNKGYSFRR